jgi:hypothetical protein
MDNVEKFLELFADFDLEIVQRGKVEKNTKPKQTEKEAPELNKTKAELKKTLNRLLKEYKSAQRSFKHNKITRQELFDFEWRLFEIQEELKKIEDQENGEY